MLSKVLDVEVSDTTVPIAIGTIVVTSWLHNHPHFKELIKTKKIQ